MEQPEALAKASGVSAFDRCKGLRKGGFLAHRNHRGMQMSQKSGPAKLSSERIVKDIRGDPASNIRPEEKIRIFLDGLGDERICIAGVCSNCRRHHRTQDWISRKRRLLGPSWMTG